MANDSSSNDTHSVQHDILIIDDDVRLATMIRDYLVLNGHQAETAHTGADGLQTFSQQNFDLVILDLMLPDTDGLEICQMLRADSTIPILMLTAKGDPMDRIVGLELGADDYLPKPFEPRELLARIKAILRRGRTDRKASNSDVLRFGRLAIDNAAMEARIDGRRCDLTAHQFRLLQILAQGSGRVLTRDHIMNHLQGSDLEAFDRSIDVHISRIRSQIEEDAKNPRRILTVRGTGYVFAKAQD